MALQEHYTVTYLKLLAGGDRFRFEKDDLLHKVTFSSCQGVTAYDVVSKKEIFYTKGYSNRKKVLKIIQP